MKKLMIFMAAATMSCVLGHADVKDIRIYDTSANVLGSHIKATSIGFSDGRLIIHAPAGDGIYELSQIANIAVGDDIVAGIDDITVDNTSLHASIRNGVLCVNSKAKILRINVYSITGSVIASGRFEDNAAAMTVNTDNQVLIVKTETTAGPKVIRLINR